MFTECYFGRTKLINIQTKKEYTVEFAKHGNSRFFTPIVEIANAPFEVKQTQELNIDELIVGEDFVKDRFDNNSYRLSTVAMFRDSAGISWAYEISFNMTINEIETNQFKRKNYFEPLGKGQIKLSFLMGTIYPQKIEYKLLE